MSDDMAAFGVYALPPAAERLRRLCGSIKDGPLSRPMRSALRRLVTLRRRGPFDVEPFPGLRARLYPAENLSDKRVFSASAVWDRAERAALVRVLRAAAVPAFFVDAGANAGLYSLALRAETGAGRLRALAIEPDAENLSRLRFNIRASGAAADVIVAPVALSDRTETLKIASDQTNRGEVKADETGTPVPARPLVDLVREAGFPRVDALKIDIEGMELPVLRHYFGNAEHALWPRLVVIEARRHEETPALAHLRSLGYEIEERTRQNAVLRPPRTVEAATGVTGNAHGNQA